MKRYILLLIIFFMIVGCKSKKEEKEEKMISSKGDLVCAYKARYSSESTLYTSYYEYNFNNNGILNSAKNVESIEFEESNEEVKEKYKNEIEEIIKEYDNIDGIVVMTNFEDKKYSFTITMDKSKMDKETIENFLLDEDRMNLYNQYIEAGYTCN